MPTYEYVCEGCSHRFDAFQSFSEEALRNCPECREDRLRRLFGTGAAILFKGSGFYETDYRSESYKQAAKADQQTGTKSSETKSSDSPATNGTSSTKSEAKSSSTET